MIKQFRVGQIVRVRWDVDLNEEEYERWAGEYVRVMEEITPGMYRVEFVDGAFTTLVRYDEIEDLSD